ncbi:hypothetical protein Purlil1_6064 [Purpureocillium lilacinum]|uniref:Mitochondrial fission 1 protein n=2 Tax=Purpureocillium TaxID=1052105 RepID=A0ABR0BZV3_PURLI|nr:hypothetical protein Purlil1_6064 [Purpureocillium lilacinum]
MRRTPGAQNSRIHVWSRRRDDQPTPLPTAAVRPLSGHGAPEVSPLHLAAPGVSPALGTRPRRLHSTSIHGCLACLPANLPWSPANDGPSDACAAAASSSATVTRHKSPPARSARRGRQLIRDDRDTSINSSETSFPRREFSAQAHCPIKAPRRCDPTVPLLRSPPSSPTSLSLPSDPAAAAMVAELPYALDAETYALASPQSVRLPLNASELNVLRAQYEKEGDMVGVQTKFNYAWGLVKSNSRHDQQLGVRLLSDIFRLSPERRRECLYYLALGNYKLGNYGEARRYNDLLLDREPANLQASDLRQLIDAKVAKEGLMGVAILSGVGIAAGVVGAFLFKNARRR